MGRHCLYLCLIGALALDLAGPVRASFDDAYLIAAADLARLPIEEQLYAVYLWQGDVPEDKRIEALRILSGHVNGLSREPAIAVPVPVCTDFSVIRASAKKYAWLRQVTEDLIDADPFSVQQIKIEWPGGLYPDGRTYAKGAFAWRVPVVGLRWFVWQTLQQVDRKPGYYDFLGLKDRKDMDALSGFDRKVADKAGRSDYLEAVKHSGVAAEPRRVVIQPVAEGRRYGTEDSKLAIDLFDPLEVLDPKDAKHDAEEWIFFLPNDFLGFFLSDDKGTRQDSAPDFIGANEFAKSRDMRIHNARACYDCHYKGKDGSRGFITFDPYFRRLHSDGVPVTSPVHAALEVVERLYLRDIFARIDADRQRHDAAVKQATGWGADEWAGKLLELVTEYDRGADAAEAAIYLGCKTEHVQQRLDDFRKKTGLLNPLFGDWIKRPESRIPRHQYHSRFGLLRKTVSYEVRQIDVRDLLLPVDYRLDLRGPALPVRPAGPLPAIPPRP